MSWRLDASSSGEKMLDQCGENRREGARYIVNGLKQWHRIDSVSCR